MIRNDLLAGEVAGLGRDGALPAGAWSSAPIADSVMAEAVAWLETQIAWRPDTVESDEPEALPVMAHRATPRRTSLDRLSRLTPALFLLVAFNVAVTQQSQMVARVFAVVFLLTIPGCVLLAASATRPRSGAVRGALACATSVVSLMLLALAADTALPRIGIDEPLARAPMLVAVDAMLLAALLVVTRRREPLTWLFGSRSPSPRQVAVVAACAVVPLAAGAGAQAVAHGHGGALATVAAVAVGVLLAGLVWRADRMPDWIVEAGLYAAGVAAIYSFSLSGDRLYGWDIQQEFAAFSTTMQANAWFPTIDRDPYQAMLSITALPTVLARLGGMSGEAIFRGVYPLLFASFPVMAYVTAARWVSRTAAAGAAAFVIVQLAFAQQLPAIARQEIALVLFGVLVVVAFDDHLPVRYRRGVAVVAGSALAFTHYSTAYVTSLALLGAWSLAAIGRVVARGPRRAGVLTLPVVLAVLACTVVWNFGVTRSGQNVTRFTEQVAERGPEFLPGSQGGSVVTRWVSGNAPRRITGDEYARRIDLIYEASAPWLQGYPDDVVAAHPVVDARAPQLAGLAPGARTVHDRSLVVVSQGFVALTGIGAMAFAWRRRRDRGAARELGLLAVAVLAFVAAMRVSGVAAEAYNQERAQIHAAAVLSVGLAAVLAWFLGRWRRATATVLTVALSVVYLASSGLAARLVGGAAPANLADAGDARERFAVTDAEVATASWLARHRHPDSIVTVDRYGLLRIWAAAVPIDRPSLQGGLTPATLDRNSYVFATESNVVGGRARGAIGADYAVYEFPWQFLDENKAAIYSTGTTAVYR